MIWPDQEAELGKSLWDKRKKKEACFYAVTAVEPGTGGGREEAKRIESVHELDMMVLVNGWLMIFKFKSGPLGLWQYYSFIQGFNT